MLRNYIAAGYPIILVVTQEPHRAELLLTTGLDGERLNASTPPITCFAWDCVSGFRKPGKHQGSDETDPRTAIHSLNERVDTVILFHNLNHFLDDIEILQLVQNGADLWKRLGNTMVIVTPSSTLPPEIEKLVHTIELPLPTIDEIDRLGQEIADQSSTQLNIDAISAATGLTAFEAETAIAYAIASTGRMDLEVICRIKAQMLKKTGFLEYWPSVDASQLGGLGALKHWIRKRIELGAFLPGTTLQRPRGILLAGVPGTGKSLSAKVIAGMLGLPLIRFDIASTQGSLVGETERKIRQGTATIEAFGSSVVWTDEIEKVFAGGHSGGQTDSGVKAGMIGHYLTWTQETTAPIFRVDTANDVSSLPGEMLRAGRYDAIFFVDLPNSTERGDILGIMWKRYFPDVPLDPDIGEMVIDKTAGFTGAEIEQVIKDSVYDGLDEALTTTIPLSVTAKERIQQLQAWAKNRARPANSPDIPLTTARKMRVMS